MDLELPAELTREPAALAAFAGLDADGDAASADLWRRFAGSSSSAGHADRVPLRFARADPAAWPPMKPKRNSYDWFIPKGILKKNWMRKHLEVLPAVVVVFADLDWSDPDFNRKKAECAERVQSVRTSLAGRGTKIAVVLVQRDTSLPLVTEDVAASERAAALCAACELSNRSLFVLPVTAENLDGYIVRLENAFYELAQNYYHQEIRSVKSHRDYLNKTTHLYLFVRHQFKIGFLNELKRDFHAAYKHYGQAYNLLMEVRATDTNIMEVKTVAGFISYKICKLAFRVNLPRDAISQFRKHMDIFKHKVGMDVLAFEHKGWQSKQAEVFADVFSEAIDNGLPAIQTQHPGLYYQQAAQHAIARREIAEEQCASAIDYPTPDPLENSTGLEFFGQRPWRPGKVALEPPDMELETQGIQALLFREREGKGGDHGSEVIIRLLQSAIAQFKNFRSPRSESHLTVTVAEELKIAKKYREALDLLTPVMSQYRFERWRPLLDAVLALGVKCAFLLGDLETYAMLCLDLCSPQSSVSPSEKARVAANVVALFSGQVPQPEQGLTSKLDEAAVTEALSSWAKKLEVGGDDKPVTVDMTDKTSALVISASFSATKFKADEKAKVVAKIANNFVGEDATVSLDRVTVTLSNSEHVLEWKAGQGEEHLVIAPGQSATKNFEFTPDADDVGGSLAVRRVAVGLSKSRVEVARTVDEATDIVRADFIIPKVVADTVDGGAFSDVNLGDEARSVEILQRDPLMTMELEYSAPALVGEWFPIEVRLDNGETASAAADVQVKACLADAFDPLIADTTVLTFDPAAAARGSVSSASAAATPGEEKQPVLIKSLESIDPQNQATCRLYVKCSTTGVRGLNLRVSYSVRTGDGLECVSALSRFVDLETRDPFSLDSSLLSPRLQPVQQAHTDEPFFLAPRLRALTVHKIDVADSWLETRPPLRLATPSHASQVKGCQLGENFETKECIPVVVKRSDLLSPLEVQEISMGKYVVKWSRADVNDESHTTTSFDIPSVRVKVSGLHVSAKLPPHGVVRTPMPARYTLRNRTDRALEFALAMEPSEAFMFSGCKQTHARIFPHSEKQFTYVLYPLVAGEAVELPRLRLTPARISQSAQDAEAVLERLLPRTVTVLPKPRNAVSEDKKGKKKEDVVDGGGERYVLGEHVTLENPPYEKGRRATRPMRR